MKYFLTLCLFVIPFAMQADIGGDKVEADVEENAIAQEGDAELYDRQYSLNPVPQSPRKTGSGSCQDSAQLSQQVSRLEKRVNALEKRISAAEPAPTAKEPASSIIETSTQAPKESL